MFSSVEVSISSRLHTLKNMNHRNYQPSRMGSATINDFRDILPSWFLPTVGWKISYPRWVEREKSSKRTVFACSVFLVGLITPTSFKPFHAWHKVENFIFILLTRKKTRFWFFKKFWLDCKASKNKTKLVGVPTQHAFSHIYVSICLRLKIDSSPLFMNCNFIRSNFRVQSSPKLVIDCNYSY